MTSAKQDQTQASTSEQPVQTPVDPNVRIVELENPIIRGSDSITQITLRKPNVGTLRNLSLQDVLKWNVEATNTVLTRISYPTLSIADLNGMDIADYTSLAVELTNFLVSAKAKSQVV
ncbi:phage tail assembly protein [Acinetobacter courvalinii]|uniref:phage tail assembly protein n=1 Tax=Acinetobacter courvalinii TaxID=280147 RepID=UPI0019015C5A|nr:phage tail assembly protein [Acinetobacter courvalinii]MBJ8418775.1 phage tail assembly protein [Acinetobacter courvalinii]